MKLRPRAGMVERQEESTVPFDRSSDIVTQREFVGADARERPERHRSERHDDRRVDNFQRSYEVSEAISHLCQPRSRIATMRVERVAENGVGDKDFVARKADRIQESLEVLAGLVAAEWNTAACGTKTTRRLGYEHHVRAHAAISMTQDCGDRLHAAAHTTRGHLGYQLLEQCLAPGKTFDSGMTQRIPPPLIQFLCC